MTPEHGIFCCPRCHVGLAAYGYDTERGRIITGELKCPSCERATPVIQGFPLFTETGPAVAGQAAIASLEEALFKSQAILAEFIDRQSRRPVFDAYAAYYPFNEALAGFLWLRDLIQESLKPGDRILDLNCRTGWTGEFLAALFPEQSVVSLWEGNQGVLAYSGYAYWLPERSRAENLEIAFLHDKRRLPFPDGAFRLVFGYDFLHHHVDRDTLTELLRVSAMNGALIFPHVHTNHSVPVPYFEREGQLVSAADWCRLWSSLPRQDNRAPCVISELALYGQGPVEVATAEHIEHYNCCVMMVPDDWLSKHLATPPRQALSGREYLFVNPLLQVDLNSGRLSIDPDAMDGGVGHLLERHPASEQDLRARIDTPLSRPQREFLYWAGKGLSYAQVCQRMHRPAGSLDTEIADLTERRILLALPVSQAMWLLQHYYRYRQPLYLVCDHRFQTLWKNLGSRYADHPVIINHDGSQFNVEHTQLLVNAVRALLTNRGIGRGDYLLIAAGGHLEVLITCWAAWLDGVIVVVIDPRTELAQIQSLTRQLAVQLIFSELADMDAAQSGCEVINFDDMASATLPEASFSSRIEPFIGQPTAAVESHVTEDSVALVLCTSGSAGTPKKVALSQGSLFRSGGILARSYGWNRGDRLLSLGPMYSMSGLRNPATAALHAGTTIVVASAAQGHIVPRALQAIEQHSVTIVSAVPAFVENLGRLADRGRNLALPTLRLVLTTASRIDAGVQRQVAAQLGVEIADYYGLTETGGICILQQPGRQHVDGSIGTAAGCLCEIRRPDNTLVNNGERGQLYIYSDNAMNGYVGTPESGLPVIDGWLATGDAARFLEDGDIQLLGRLDGARKNRQGEFVSADTEGVQLV